jgi:ribosomal protein L12E/L44/L45/RPP1/RPP2
MKRAPVVALAAALLVPADPASFKSKEDGLKALLDAQLYSVRRIRALVTADAPESVIREEVVRFKTLTEALEKAEGRPAPESPAPAQRADAEAAEEEEKE